MHRMTRSELLAAVPLRKTECGSEYVSLADIPPPWRMHFWAAMADQPIPLEIREQPSAMPAAYWLRWANGMSIQPNFPIA